MTKGMKENERKKKESVINSIVRLDAKNGFIKQKRSSTKKNMWIQNEERAISI